MSGRIFMYLKIIHPIVRILTLSEMHYIDQPKRIITLFKKVIS